MRLWGLSALAGALFGAAVSLCNAADGVLAHAVAVVIGSGAGWAVAGILAGAFLARRSILRWVPAIGATVLLLVAVGAYYLCDYLVSSSSSVSVEGLPPMEGAGSTGGFQDAHDLTQWSLAALVLGPILGHLGGLALRRLGFAPVTS